MPLNLSQHPPTRNKKCYKFPSQFNFDGHLNAPEVGQAKTSDKFNSLVIHENNRAFTFFPSFATFELSNTVSKKKDGKKLLGKLQEADFFSPAGASRFEISRRLLIKIDCQVENLKTPIQINCN